MVTMQMRGFLMHSRLGALLGKFAFEISVSTVATLIATYGLANFMSHSQLMPRNSSEAVAVVAQAQPAWVGDLSIKDTESMAVAPALTSASFLLRPSKAQESQNVALRTASGCANEVACPAKPAKSSHVPHKPREVASPPPVLAANLASTNRLNEAAREPIKTPEPTQDPPQAAAAPAPGWQNWVKLGEHLRVTDTLIKPFAVVSDSVSNLIKRF
jgi:hypothetical protein